MRIAYGYRSVETPPEGTVMTIGTFDGLHVGHQQLIQQVVTRAREIGGTAVVYSFYPPPWRVLGSKAVPYLITTFEDKAELLSQLGVDLLVTEEFTPDIRSLSREQFADEVFDQRLAVRELVVGYDFGFARNREGNAAFLRARWPDRPVTELAPVQVGGEVVGCSRIRRLVVAGDVSGVETLLGRHHFVSGAVVRGHGRGRTIGFPTANVQVRTELLPPPGVYAVRLQVRGEDGARWLPGVANLGFRPTFSERELALEVHLFDYTGNLYGAAVKVGFVERLREERRFPSVDALVAQIHADAAQARALLGVPAAG